MPGPGAALLCLLARPQWPDALLGYLTAWLFLTRSFLCGLYFCIFLLKTVEVPGTACPKPGPGAVPAPLRSLAGAAPRMWQEPEILLQDRKECHNFPPALSTSLFGTARRRWGKISEIAEVWVGLGNSVQPWAREGICVGMDSAPGLGLPPQPGSVRMAGEPEHGGLQALQAQLPSPVFPPLGTTHVCPCFGSCGMLLISTGLFPLCDDSLELLRRESPQPGPGCARGDALGCFH